MNGTDQRAHTRKTASVVLYRDVDHGTYQLVIGGTVHVFTLEELAGLGELIASAMETHPEPIVRLETN